MAFGAGEMLDPSLIWPHRKGEASLCILHYHNSAPTENSGKERVERNLWRERGREEGREREGERKGRGRWEGGREEGGGGKRERSGERGGTNVNIMLIETIEQHYSLP